MFQLIIIILQRSYHYITISQQLQHNLYKSFISSQNNTVSFNDGQIYRLVRKIAFAIMALTAAKSKDRATHHILTTVVILKTFKTLKI